MIRRNILLVLSFLAFLPFANAQFAIGDYMNKDLARLPKTTTIVVMTGDAAFDTAMKAAMERSWTESPVEFMTAEEAASKMTSTRYSVLKPVVLSFSSNDFTSGKLITTKSMYLALMMGVRKSESDLVPGDFLAYGIFDDNISEENLGDAAYRLPLMVSGMQKAIDLVQEKKFTGSERDAEKFFQTEYNKNTQQLKTKTLLVPKELFNAEFSQEEFAKYYPGKVEIADRAQIEQALLNYDENYAVLLKSQGSAKHIYVVDAVTWNPIFWETTAYSTKMDKRDAKSIAKASGQ